MPGAEALARQGFGMALGGIEHDQAVDRSQRADVHAQATRDGRAHLPWIQSFAFDFAGLERFQCERLPPGFIAPGEAERFHAPEQASLSMADGGQGCGESRQIMAPRGLSRQPPGVRHRNLRKSCGA